MQYNKVIESFQTALDEVILEKESPKKGEYTPYQKHFKSIMKKWGIKSPGELKTDEDKKKFFDDVNKSWKSKAEKGEK